MFIVIKFYRFDKQLNRKQVSIIFWLHKNNDSSSSNNNLSALKPQFFPSTHTRPSLRFTLSKFHHTGCTHICKPLPIYIYIATFIQNIHYFCYFSLFLCRSLSQCVHLDVQCVYIPLHQFKRMCFVMHRAHSYSKIWTIIILLFRMCINQKNKKKIN